VSPRTLASLTVDNLIFGYRPGQLSLLLVQHGEGRSAGQWGLPGDWLREDESLDQCAARVLETRTGLADMELRQLHTFSDPDRYPGQRIVTTAYWTLVPEERQVVRPSPDEQAAGWLPVDDAPPLIFDHQDILAAGLVALRWEVRHRPQGLDLLGPRFTFLALQQLYEVLTGRNFDKPNFRRKLQAYGHLVDTGKTVREAGHRSAKLFRFDRRRYRALERQGFSFSL
jgi:hypothetical protein